MTTTYAYDAASRLDELSHDLASTTNDQTYEFTYNAAGQSLSRDGSNANYDWSPISPGTQSYARNGLNQYPSVGGSSFTYDGRGNLTSDGTTSYGYDVYNRLTSAGSATLAYDPAGRLYQTSLSGATTRFQYDGVDLIAEYNTSGTLLKRYVHGPAFDEPVVWYEGSGTSDRRWLITDQLGSVVAITNGSGAATNINTHDEYGRPGGSNVGRFQYTGQTWLSEASLYYYKARVYSPVLGRFMQSDPILWEGGLNLYAYVGDDPVNWRDWLGLDELPACSPDYSGACQITVIATRPGVVGGGSGGGGAGSGETDTDVIADDVARQREEQRQICERIAQSAAEGRQRLGGLYAGPRWNSLESLRYDARAAQDNAKTNGQLSWLLGILGGGSVVTRNRVVGDHLTGATVVGSAAYGWVANEQQSRADALRARITELEHQRAGMCPVR